MIRKMCGDLEVLLGLPALAAPRNPNPRLGLLFPVSFELSSRVDAWLRPYEAAAGPYFIVQKIVSALLEHEVSSRMAVALPDADCVCGENNLNASLDIFLISLGGKRLWRPYTS